MAETGKRQISSGRARGSKSSDRDENSTVWQHCPCRSRVWPRICGTYGQVTDIKIIDGKPAGSQKCAFVYFEREAEAKVAIQVLNYVYKFRCDADKPIRVEFCREAYHLLH